MHKLLGPGGNLDMVRAVLEAGADASFVGALGLSRRMGSKNELTHRQIKEATAIASGKNIWVAINRTQGIAPEHIDFIVDKKIPDYLEWGITSLIVGEYNLMRAIRDRYTESQLKIVASVGCNIRDEEGIKKAKEHGASIIVPCSDLNVKQIVELNRIAVRYGLETEVLVLGTNCIGGVGGCSLYSFFPEALQKESYTDSDGFTITKINGDPENGGGCYRPCLYLADAAIRGEYYWRL